MASTSCQSTPRYTFAFGHEGSMQMVHRVFELLRLVAAERGGGLRLTDIAERSQLPLPTAHRLLRSLEAERAVIYDPFMRVYYVGYDFLQQPRDTLDGRLRQHFHSLLQQVAEHTDGTALLATMQEYDVLYIDLVAAMFPPGNPMVVGGRRPLGAGPAGVVLLASLPPRKQHEVIMANAQRYLRFNGIDSRRVHAMVQEFRREGYSSEPQSYRAWARSRFQSMMPLARLWRLFPSLVRASGWSRDAAKSQTGFWIGSPDGNRSMSRHGTSVNPDASDALSSCVRRVEVMYATDNSQRAKYNCKSSGGYVLLRPLTDLGAARLWDGLYGQGVRRGARSVDWGLCRVLKGRLHCLRRRRSSFRKRCART